MIRGFFGVRRQKESEALSGLLATALWYMPLSLRGGYQSGVAGWPVKAPAFLCRRTPKKRPAFLLLLLIALCYASTFGQTAATEPDRALATGVGYCQQEQWDKCLATLQPLLPVQTQNSALWYWVGVAQFRLHRFEDARNSVAKAIVLNQKDSNAYRVLGLIELELGNRNDAYKLWQVAIHLNPRDAKAHYFIARLFYEASYLPKAEEWLRQTIELDRHDYRALLYLGLVREALGRNEEALDLYQQALKESQAQKQPFSWIYSSMGKLLRVMGRTQEARTILEEGLREAPDGLVYSELGQILAEQGEAERAEAMLREAIRREPSLPDPYYHLGRLLSARGQKDESKAVLATFQKLKDQQKKQTPQVSATR